MKPTLFLLGPSDLDAQNTVARESVGQGMSRVEFSLAGILPILPFIDEDKTLSANSRSAILGLHRIQRPRRGDLNVFNLVGDADSSPNMLRQVQSVIDQIRPSRCFNPPGNVLKTARATLPETLAGIGGCLVPRVEAARPRDFTELKSLCRGFNHWPLIVRSRGEHGGRQMLLLEDIDQLDTYKSSPWLYEDICLIEYHDYQGPDGLYQKNRVIVIDGAPYPRHALFSRHWKINASSRAELMDEDMELVRREQRFTFTEVRDFYPVFEEMHRRTGLDLFGVDFAIRDGKVLVFEANPCMKFLDRTHQGNSRYTYLDELVKALKRAIKKMLVRA